MKNITWKTQLLLGVFCGLLVAMNLLGGKVTTMFDVSVSVAIFMTPFTFLITDVVEEVHGKKVVGQFLLAGFVTMALVFGFVMLSVWLPANERYQWGSEYAIIFGASLRMIIASLVAFFLGQLHDIWAFSFWKKVTKGKMLWVRNNLSTIVSQAIDTFVFMMIAFYQLTPKFDFWFVIQMGIPYYLFKLFFAVLDTPLVYAGVWWMRKEVVDNN